MRWPEGQMNQTITRKKVICKMIKQGKGHKKNLKGRPQGH